MKRRLRRRVKITISIVLALLMILGMTFGNVPGPFNALKAQAVEGDEQGGPEIEGEGEGQGEGDGQGEGQELEELMAACGKLKKAVITSDSNLGSLKAIYYTDALELYKNNPDALGEYECVTIPDPGFQPSDENPDEEPPTIHVVNEIEIQGVTFTVNGFLVVLTNLSFDGGNSKIVGEEANPEVSFIKLFPMDVPENVFYDLPDGNWEALAKVDDSEGAEFEYTEYSYWDPNKQEEVKDGTYRWAPRHDGGGEEEQQQQGDVEAVFDVLYDVSEQSAEGGGEVSLIYGAEDEDGSLNVVEKGKNPPDPKPFGIKREFLQRQATPVVTITPYEGFYIKEATYRIEDKEDPELKNQWTLVDPNDPLQTDPIEITLTQFGPDGADGSTAVIHGEEDSFYLIVVFEAIPEEPDDSLRILINGVDGEGKKEGGSIAVWEKTDDGNKKIEGKVLENSVEYTVSKESIENRNVLIEASADSGWEIESYYYPVPEQVSYPSPSEKKTHGFYPYITDFGEDNTVCYESFFKKKQFTIEIASYKESEGTITVSPQAGYERLENSERYTFDATDWENVVITATPNTEQKYEVLSATWDGSKNTDENTKTVTLKLTKEPDDNEVLNCTVTFGVSDAAMIDNIADTIYGYYPAGATTDDDIIAKLKEYLAKEIFGTFFAGKPADGDHPAEPGMYSGFADWKEVQAALSASNTAVQDSDLLVGLPFVDFTFGLPKAGKTIRVYVFENVGDIIVATQNKGTNDWTFTIATVPKTDGKGNDVTVLVPEYDGFPVVYGNGAQGIAGLQSDSTEIMTCHVTQEWSGHVQFPDSIINDDVIGDLNGRLIVVPMIAGSAAVRITGEEYCDGWDFGNITTFLAYETRGKASDALIYIKNNKVTVSSVAFGNKNPAVDAANAPTVTGVALDEQSGLPEGVITVAKSGENFVVAFNTNYDVIPIKITMSNGKTVFITLHRVAIRLEQKADDGKPTVSATYYYPTGKSKPGDSDQVTLFVMITTSSGKIVKELKSGSGTMLDSLDPDTDNPHYNAHGEKFLVWSETDCSYGSVVSVEVIAYKPGNSTRFDGVMAGSGKGVKWQKAQLQ